MIYLFAVAVCSFIAGYGYGYRLDRARISRELAEIQAEHRRAAEALYPWPVKYYAHALVTDTEAQEPVLMRVELVQN